MMNEKLLCRINNNLQKLLEAALDYAVIINCGDRHKTDPFRRMLLNKYNALRKANIGEFKAWDAQMLNKNGKEQSHN